MCIILICMYIYTMLCSYIYISYIHTYIYIIVVYYTVSRYTTQDVTVSLGCSLFSHSTRSKLSPRAWIATRSCHSCQSAAELKCESANGFVWECAKQHSDSDTCIIQYIYVYTYIYIYKIYRYIMCIYIYTQYIYMSHLPFVSRHFPALVLPA